MSRTVRATLAALFSYVRIGFAIAVGLWLVPYTLHRVGATNYGYWLASGELLAYAALSEFGVLTTLPWLIAEADGRGDRDRIRSLLLNGGAAALLSAAACLLLSVILWFWLPVIVHMGPAQRSAVLGPVLIVAVGGVLATPLRVFAGLLSGLQDVRFTGLVDLVSVVLNTVLTVILLRRGYGLYALAIANALPPLVVGLWNLLRARAIAPDVLRGWHRPEWQGIRALFGEGLGTWLGGWGWRLISATDGLVLAALGDPRGVAALAVTNKLAQALTQVSWVPCDSGLVGLAHLAAEQQGRRVREAITVLMRVYLALSGSVACIIIAANPAFVAKWVGANLYAGGTANALIAVVVIAMTFGHALAVVPSVLGQRIQIGYATLWSGALHVVMAFGLGFRFGIVGVLAAGVLSHGVVFAMLAWRPFGRATGMRETALLADVLRPWALRMVPLAALAFAVQRAVGTPPLFVTIGLGGMIGALSMWFMRGLYLEFGPVRAMYDRLWTWRPLRRAAEARSL